jgi:peptidoglycan/LPS O-acetylase OafA/YrhL
VKYRADIDGLRAVAVLSVLAFHVGLFRMTGGFVGVDVFFVISGYLVSSIVFSEIELSRFSIVAFYERRIRRIFPALFAMLIPFTVVAVIYFLPNALVEYSKSLLASTGFASNLYFWGHSGYFDSPLSNPLLHTWSLAVEEQFYILFPILIVLVSRIFPRRLRTSVVVLFGLSLAASAAVVYYDQVTAFYMIYTRAWELLLGTLLSMGMFPRLQSTWVRNLVSVAGIGMILYSVFFFTEATLFPGLSAVWPCLGTALIIGAGESGSSLVSSVLSWRPAVFVGLISYSLYLWHWPVIILHRMGVLFSMSDTVPSRFMTLLAPGQYDKIVEVTVSIVLAILSWLFVERPFRNGPLRLHGRPLFTLAATAMFIFVTFSSLTMIAGGFQGRFPARAVEIASYPYGDENRQTMRVGSCFITSSEGFDNYDYSMCLRREAGKNTYLLLGDSHSAALWHGLASSLPGTNIMQASASGCAPVVDTSHSFRPPDCRRMMDYIFNVYLPAHPVQGLLLAARWQSDDIGRVAETIEWARQHQMPVILFGPVPEYDMPLPLLLAYSIAWKKPDLVSQHRIGERQSLDAQLQKLAASTWQVRYISLYDAICQDRDCKVYSDAEQKIPLMFDNSHLSSAGSLVIMHHLVNRGEMAEPRIFIGTVSRPQGYAGAGPAVHAQTKLGTSAGPLRSERRDP